MANRIQILNWRQHGDDESYCAVNVYAADDPGTCQEAVEAEFEVRPSDEDGHPEGTYYVNDDITIADGDEFVGGGRRFRVTITEVK